MKRDDAQIYIYNHKPLDYGIWDNTLYTPIEVGAFYREPYMEQLRDNAEEDNISFKNPVYLELTGLYHIWKHCHPSKFKGVCQYRRRLEFTEDFDFETILKGYDAIAAEPMPFNVRRQYEMCHSKKDMEILEEVVKGLYPDYAQAWDDFINNGTKLYYSNGLIMRTEAFDAYCEWLFPIIDRFMESRGWLTNEDVFRTVQEEIKAGSRNGARGFMYQSEIGAFTSERLMTLYLRRNCKVLEVPYKKYENLII